MDDDLAARIPGVLLGRSTSCLREAVRPYLLFEEPENGMTCWPLCAEISEARPGRARYTAAHKHAAERP